MKKWLCCFSFMFLLVSGILVGRLGGQWFFPDSHVNTVISVEEDDGADEEEGTKTSYQGKEWRSFLLWQYAGYFVITIYFLGGKKKIGIVGVGWFLYGGYLGIYGAGTESLYGAQGRYYWMAGAGLAACVLSLVTGFCWKYWKDRKTTGYYYNKQKRIRSLVEGLRIRVMPFLGYGLVLLICWIIDYEIIRRIQWSMLLHMVGNVVD